MRNMTLLLKIYFKIVVQATQSIAIDIHVFIFWMECYWLGEKEMKYLPQKFTQKTVKLKWYNQPYRYIFYKTSRNMRTWIRKWLLNTHPVYGNKLGKIVLICEIADGGVLVICHEMWNLTKNSIILVGKKDLLMWLTSFIGRL